MTNVQISPIKFKESIFNKERLKRSYQASDFLPETEISPRRSKMIGSKRLTNRLCFLLILMFIISQIREI